MEKKNVLILIILLVVGFCAGLLVLMGVGGGLYYLSQRRASTVALPSPETAILSPTDIPTLSQQNSPQTPQLPATTQEPAAEPQPNVDFNGIRFFLSPQLAQGVLPELISAAEGDPAQSMPGEIHPEYTQFTLQGYLLADTFHDPRIYVYPLPAYRSMDGVVDDVANRLSGIIEKQPEQIESLPFLPLWNAAQQFHAQLKFIEFKNGRGVRFITQFAQSYVVINNTDLFYSFQGISEDGEWYVAMVLPVSHPSLPSSPDASGVEPLNAETYYQQMSDQLSLLGGETFSPSLILLDELVSSLRVK